MKFSIFESIIGTSLDIIMRESGELDSINDRILLILTGKLVSMIRRFAFLLFNSNDSREDSASNTICSTSYSTKELEFFRSSIKVDLPIPNAPEITIY
jgi:hypothetical protein